MKSTLHIPLTQCRCHSSVSLRQILIRMWVIALCFPCVWAGCHTDGPVVKSSQPLKDSSADLLKQAAYIGAQSPDQPKREFRFFQYLMGTQFNIQLLGYDQLTAQAAARAAFNEVRRVEHLVSSWRSDSEMGHLNLAAGDRAVKISLESAWLLCQSRAISTLTRGAFDVTWAALKGLWDFRHARIPNHELLQRRLRSVGMEHLHLKLAPSLSSEATTPRSTTKSPVSKPTSSAPLNSQTQDTCKTLVSAPLPPPWSRFSAQPPVAWSQRWSAQLILKSARVDLGGIAKGFGVDQAARVLRRLGYQDFLIDGGGRPPRKWSRSWW